MTGRKRTALVVAVAVVVLGGGAAAYALTRPDDKPAPVAATSDPTPTHLDERAACALAAPAAVDGAQIIRDFIAHPDGSTIDQPTLGRAVTALAQVQAYGPPDLREYVTNLHDPLAAIQASFADHESREVQTLLAAAAAQSITDTCRAYAG